jgi:hypothetical protein
MMKHSSIDRLLGLMEANHILLRTLGSNVIQENYGMFFKHFCDLATNPKFEHNGQSGNLQTASNNRAIVQKLFVHLLKEVIGKDMLGENGKVDAIKWIFANVIDPTVHSIIATNGRVVIDVRSLNIVTVALQEISNLLVDLGQAAFPIANSISSVVTLTESISTWNLRFYLSAGWCIRSFLVACPNVIPKTIPSMLSRLEGTVDHLDTLTHDFDAIAGATSVAAVAISALPYRKEYMSFEWLSFAFHLAQKMLRSAGRYIESVSAIRDDTVCAHTVSLYHL